MIDSSIYRDMAKRTNGDIYIGVVGPVRTGKSTFIKKFMETAILPRITDERERTRANDEMPQSAAGKTVMTCEPKFVPEEAVTIQGEDVSARVRMVDCVGFLVDGALGQEENGEPRMVHTPWTENTLPFSQAAELGTQKVIHDHATVGILVTTDGTVADLPREAYVPAEKKTIQELRESGIPFLILLNSAQPQKPEAEELAIRLENEYAAPVALINCLSMDETDVRHILGMLLGQFALEQVNFYFPEWLDALSLDTPLMQSLWKSLHDFAASAKRVSDVRPAAKCLEENENLSGITVDPADLSAGTVNVHLNIKRKCFYDLVSAKTGISVDNDGQLLSMLKQLSDDALAYQRVAEAIRDGEEKGYGIVMPDVADLHLEEPEIVKGAGGYGVRLRASAKSLHMIRADIETEINPIVGTEAQSEEIVKYLLDEFKQDPASIWQSNIFGKSLYELVNEGLHTKLEHMPEESRVKLSQTLGRILNEGSGGLICIIL